MFRATSVRFSALSKRTKRVRVQLLKDFPMFNLYKGQVTKVKPSFMRNYLHNFNGARYVMSESDIDVELLSRSQERDTLVREKPNTDMNSTEVSDKIKKTSGNGNDRTTKEVKQKQEKPKGILEKNITIEDVKIPGLQL
ncbi:hypothetical protein HG537_0F00810 [Torulaspora globosa]|uniref:Uncharacterized protein n=1 Tax=Torulaspora globosa TaxID=48254 RepID=A0A7H9HVC3_9SACH|nr:hypothetical protein HG537_0F00810 [Torulaspora sp. CBS 2947]